MKLKWFIFILLCFFPASAFAVDITNPALSFSPKKEIIGLEYTFSGSEMKPAEPTSLSITNFESDQIYVKGAYSFFDGNEVFLKVGAANAKIESAFGNKGDFGDSYSLSAGAGAKQSLKLTDNVRIGAALGYTYYGDYRDQKSYMRSGQLVEEAIDVNNPSEMNAALAVSYIDPDFTPFAGILASWRRLEVKDHLTEGGTTTTTVARFKEDDILGLLVGVEYFRENFKATVEVQVFKRPSAGLCFNLAF